MSKAQREAVHQAVRDYPLDFSGDLAVARRMLHEIQTSRPLPDDVRVSPTDLGGIPSVAVALDGVDTPNMLLHFHGGGYAAGSASDATSLIAAVIRPARARAIAVDYRLAPEHPYPAAVDDCLAAYRALLDSGVPASRIAFTGESAGGGLVLATLLAAKAAGLPQPAAAVAISAWVDVTNSGESMRTRAAVDPSLTPADLAACADYYAGAADRTDPLISPLFGDLAGLAPLLLQVGGDEILLDDSTRLAARAATANVPVLLDVTPEVPHVFQGMSAVLDEAGEALVRIGAFLQSHWDTAGPALNPQIIGQAEKHHTALLERALSGTTVDERQWITLNLALAADAAVEREAHIAHVADVTAWEKDGIDAALHALVGSGLLAAGTDARLEVTAAGRDLVTGVRGRMNEVLSHAYDTVSPADHAVAARALTAITAALSAELAQSIV